MICCDHNISLIITTASGFAQSSAQSSAAEPGPDGYATPFHYMAHISWLEKALKDILRELDALDALKPDSELMLRCTVGELAVMAGGV